MFFDELFTHTFKAMRQELGQRPVDPRPLWQQTLRNDSTFCKATVAAGYLTREQLCHAVQRYRLGRTRDGGVIFWQIDTEEHIHDGKVMYYRTDCHRDHDHHPTWISALLKRQYHCEDIDWRPEHCLFGLHLRNRQQPIAVVEAEKTAVILSEYYPAYCWMATGGLTELSVSRLKPLQGCKVVLFPDTDEQGDAYRHWFEVAEAASDVFCQPVTVSSLLERNATAAQKAAKIDLVDLLFPHD